MWVLDHRTNVVGTPDKAVLYIHCYEYTEALSFQSEKDLYLHHNPLF